MAKEIVAWCDWHLEDDEDTRVPGKPVRVSFGGDMREVDLCDECEKRLVAPLREFLADHGQPIAAPKLTRQQPESMTCPSCGKGYKKRESMRKHMERVHGLSMSTGEPLASASQSDAETLLPMYECPDCTQTFTSSQGIGMHRAKVHGWISPNSKAAKAAARA